MSGALRLLSEPVPISNGTISGDATTLHVTFNGSSYAYPTADVTALSVRMHGGEVVQRAGDVLQDKGSRRL